MLVPRPLGAIFFFDFSSFLGTCCVSFSRKLYTVTRTLAFRVRSVVIFMPIALRLARIVLYPLIVYFLLNMSFAAEAAPPSGFVTQHIATGLALPTDMALAPDGRIFITLKNGDVRIVQNDEIIPSPALSLPVSTGGDRGLLSIVLDPNFAANNFAYLLYTTPANHERLSRFTVSGNAILPGSERIILENPTTWGGFLNAAAARIGPDGKMYITLGSNGLGANTQDLSNLDGKLLRINIDGTIPSDNPFLGIPGAQRAIYAYGFRNPWKISFDERGRAIVADVGETQFEKVVRIAQAGGNYGWPEFEGDCRPSCGSVTPPLFVVPHNGEGAAVVGGAVYRATTFPAEYHRNYFFGDYVQGYIKRVTFDEGGNVTAIRDFDMEVGAVAGIEQGRDGCLYYFTIFPGDLFKVCFGTTSVTLEAHASSDVSYGRLHLPVRFSSAGSFDPKGAALNYAWEFGDGGTSTAQNPAYTYTKQGVYSVRLTISNANGSESTRIFVWAGYLPPTITMTAPARDFRYKVGDVVPFGASAQDPQDGTLPPSAFFWQVVFHHNDHIHSPQDIIGVRSGTYTIPGDGESVTDTWHEFRLTVTNSIGLSTTSSINISPRTANVFLTSEPSGLRLVVNGQPVTTPYVLGSVVGFTHTISAPSPQTIGGNPHNFSSWSDGGAATHAIKVPDFDTTTTAVFRHDTGGTTTITSQATTDAASYTAGTPVRIAASFTSPTTIDPALIDIELWSGGRKIDQFTTTSRLVAATPTSITWNPSAPHITGPIIVKLAVFRPDWTHVYHWNDNAGTFSVTGGTSEPRTFRDRIMLDAVDYLPGSSATIQTFISPNQALSGVVLDTEIYDSQGVKRLQRVEPITLAANQEIGKTWTVTVPTEPGSYPIRVGVFKNDWTAMHYWNSFAGTLIVRTPPAPTFVVSADMPKTQFAAGEATSVTTRITATEALANVVITTEIYDSKNTKILQRVIPASLQKNVQFATTWNITVPTPKDAYIVKVGVFSADWKTLYFWKDRAFQFFVGTPPGPPQPGVTYPIRIIEPTDGSTVSGVVELKAVIDTLAIDTYTIGWRTGSTGGFAPMDTDPITQNYKHTWIDFGPWTWNADKRYPLEFQATDGSGRRIGDTTITVIH